jgi:5'-nucleotidase
MDLHLVRSQFNSLIAPGRIRTLHGHVISPLHMRPEDFDIAEAAVVLSRECRFGNHLPVHYSVAEHSLFVERLVAGILGAEDIDTLPKNLSRWAILHDLPEAYLRDLPAPIKHTEDLAGYRQAEERAAQAMCTRFHLPPEQPIEVTVADKLALVIEMRDVRNHVDMTIPVDCQELCKQFRILRPMSHGDAEAAFLERARELGLEEF